MKKVRDFIKDIKNARWKVRYENLKKKDEEKIIELECQITKLEKQLDSDENVRKVRNTEKYCKMLKRQRDELREELKSR